MRIAIVGGGPGGLYFATLMKTLDPAHEITVWERNAPDDTFGFGVVFSDETLGSIEGADRVVHERMERSFARWTDIDVALTDRQRRAPRVHRRRPGLRGDVTQGAVSRSCREQVAELGVEVQLQRRGARPRQSSEASYDLVLACRRLGSQVRARTTPTASARRTGPPRQQVQVLVRHRPGLRGVPVQRMRRSRAPSGPRATPTRTRARPHRRDARENVWRRARLDQTEEDLPPGVSDEHAVERVAEIFADELQGHEVLTNNSKWLNFHTVRNEHWHDGDVVLARRRRPHGALLDRLRRQLAIEEDALALAACLRERPTLRRRSRPTRPSAGRSSSRRNAPGTASMECADREHRDVRDQEPAQFVFDLLTRSRRIAFDASPSAPRRLTRGQRIEAEFGRSRAATTTPAMFRDPRRRTATEDHVMLLHEARYITATDDARESHLVHLGGKALGGAGLVITKWPAC